MHRSSIYLWLYLLIINNLSRTFQPTSSMSLSCKSRHSPSVVFKSQSSSVTSVTCQISLGELTGTWTWLSNPLLSYTLCLMTYALSLGPLKLPLYLPLVCINRACPLERFHLLQHGNAKRDSIYCKTRQWKFYWLQNATRYAISCFMYYCLKNAIIDSKTRFFVWHMPLTTRVPVCTWQWIIAEASSLLNPLTHSSKIPPLPPLLETLYY